jgi:UDP-N-acetylglucosamine 2-epimerase (non-hydrolysing)
VSPSRIAITGNTVIDALFWMRARVRGGRSMLPPCLNAELVDRRMLFVTAHRRESFGAGIERICTALQSLVRLAEDVVVVMAMHPNPAVRETVRARLGEERRILLIEPQPYSATVELIDRAYLVLTDSGGLQEEAPAIGTPALVLRDSTERPEGVEAGASILVGTDSNEIVKRVLALLWDSALYARMAAAVSPYGDGDAARRIAVLLEGAPARRPFKTSFSDRADLSFDASLAAQRVQC